MLYDSIAAKAILKGLASFVPAVYAFMGRRTGGTVSARYCYSVWLRHLVMLEEHGLPTWPEAVAELGPGDSIQARKKG